MMTKSVLRMQIEYQVFQGKTQLENPYISTKSDQKKHN